MKFKDINITKRHDPKELGYVELYDEYNDRYIHIIKYQKEGKYYQCETFKYMEEKNEYVTTGLQLLTDADLQNCIVTKENYEI